MTDDVEQLRAELAEREEALKAIGICASRCLDATSEPAPAEVWGAFLFIRSWSDTAYRKGHRLMNSQPGSPDTDHTEHRP